MQLAQNQVNGKKRWRIALWAAALILHLWAIVAGLTSNIPLLGLNQETTRNIFYHVPLWFSMMAMLYASVYYSIRFLQKSDLEWDLKAFSAAQVGIVFGILGLITGIIWSRVTWAEAISNDWSMAAWWSWDPKQTLALIGLLIYLAYFILRRSFDEPMQRAKLSAVFNVFSAATLAPLFYIIPRFLTSNHPNTSGQGDSISSMGPEFRLVFWPAIFGSICLAILLLDLRVRLARVEQDLNELEA